jgi:hypothetical protein
MCSSGFPLDVARGLEAAIVCRSSDNVAAISRCL